MKNLFIIFTFLIFVTSNSAYSDEKVAEGAVCKDEVVVSVNGLVCDFCARALEKTFGKKDEVSGVSVDLDTGQVVIALNDGQTMENSLITKLITDSGYNISSFDKGC